VHTPFLYTKAYTLRLFGIPKALHLQPMSMHSWKSVALRTCLLIVHPADTLFAPVTVHSTGAFEDGRQSRFNKDRRIVTVNGNLIRSSHDNRAKGGTADTIHRRLLVLCRINDPVAVKKIDWIPISREGLARRRKSEAITLCSCIMLTYTACELCFFISKSLCPSLPCHSGWSGARFSAFCSWWASTHVNAWW